MSSSFFEQLPKFPVRRSYDLVQINEGDYAAFSIIASAHERLLVYRESERNWIHVKAISHVKICSCISYPETNTLLLVVELKRKRYQLVTINLDSPSRPVLTVKLSLDQNFSLMKIAGGVLYMFGYKQQFAVVDMISWEFLLYPIYETLTFFERAFYLEDTDSLLMQCQKRLNTKKYRLKSNLYKLSLQTRQFTLCDWLQPAEDATMAEVLRTRDGRYIIFVGEYPDGVITQTIRVYDCKIGTLTKSKLRCPGHGYHKSVIMSSSEKDGLLVFGFVRTTFKAKEFNKVQIVPHYLIQMMAKWVSNEFIHLLDCDGGRHWKISVDAIVQSST